MAHYAAIHCRDSKQLDLQCSMTDIPPPQSATLGLYPVARELLLISRPTEGRRLSWPEYSVGLRPSVSKSKRLFLQNDYNISLGVRCTYCVVYSMPQKSNSLKFFGNIRRKRWNNLRNLYVRLLSLKSSTFRCWDKCRQLQ